MNQSERSKGSSLLWVLLQHIFLLLTLRHKGHGLWVTSSSLFYVLLALPVLTLTLVTTEFHSLVFRSALIAVLLLTHTRNVGVGVALIMIATDVVGAMLKALGYPAGEAIFDFWGTIAFFVFIFFADRSPKS